MQWRQIDNVSNVAKYLQRLYTQSLRESGSDTIRKLQPFLPNSRKFSSLIHLARCSSKSPSAISKRCLSPYSLIQSFSSSRNIIFARDFSFGSKKDESVIDNQTGQETVARESSTSGIQTGSKQEGNEFGNTLASRIGKDFASDQTETVASVADSSTTTSEVYEESVSKVIESNWYDPVISYLSYIHDSTELPWWSLIALVTVGVRLILLPFSLMAMRNAAIMNSVQPRLKEIQDLMFDAKSRGKLDEAKKYQQQYMKVIKENDVNPFRSMLGPLVQTPVFLSFFFGLRKMAETMPSFKTEGTSWFEDLSKPDPLFLMPTFCAGIFLLNLQLSLINGASPTNKQWINIFRLFGLAIIPFTAKMPCAIFCYWIPSNLFSFLQSLVFSISGVRALLRLPPLPDKRKNTATTQSEGKSETAKGLTDMKGTVHQKGDQPDVQNISKVFKKKEPVKLYDRMPKHRHYTRLLCRQESKYWTSSVY